MPSTMYARPSRVKPVGLAGEISSLAGVMEAIEAIRTAQKSFNEKRITYEQNIAAKNAKQKSAELKKMFLERVNTSLLPYLTSLKSMKSAGYSDFIEGVSQIIANTNNLFFHNPRRV